MNLSKLIVEDQKLKEDAMLRKKRAQSKKPSIVDRDEDDIATNLVSTKFSNFVGVVVGHIMLLPCRH